MSEQVYDIAIIGGGAAGLTAGIYASRSRLSTLLIEKMYPGGQVMMCETIENFPGFPHGVHGSELSESFNQQAQKFGMETMLVDVNRLDLKGYEKLIYASDGTVIRAKTVILSLGAKPRTLGVTGEGQFIGRGVSYCAVCDGAFFKDCELVVVGGGDTAVEDSIYLTRYARHVHIVHRRDSLRAQKIIQERALANPQITVHWNSVVQSIYGKDKVEGVTLEDVRTHQQSQLSVDGVFVLIGLDPNTAMLSGQIDLDDQGYILTDPNMACNIPGVFAAGDVRQKLLRQIITACADGAIAATAAEKYIEGSL